jgi:hypothetical protein
MAYVIGTFEDRALAGSMIKDLKDMGLPEVEYAITDRTDTVKGWLQRLFGLGDDAAKLQSKGVPPDEAQWYDSEVVLERDMHFRYSTGERRSIHPYPTVRPARRS